MQQAKEAALDKKLAASQMQITTESCSDSGILSQANSTKCKKKVVVRFDPPTGVASLKPKSLSSTEVVVCYSKTSTHGE